MKKRAAGAALSVLPLILFCAACRAGSLSISLDSATYGAGDTIAPVVTVETGGGSAVADGYIGVLTPAGRLLCYRGGRLSTDILPLVSSWMTADINREILHYTVTGAEPAGSYLLYAALVAPGGDPLSPADRLALARAGFRIEGAAVRIPYGRLRVFCSDDLPLITGAHATFSVAGPFEFTIGDPWRGYGSRADFEEELGWFRGFTAAAHARGVTVISYIAQYLSGEYGRGPAGLYMNGIYENRWDEYGDYFGPRPAVGPTGWLQLDAAGNPAEFVWVPPDGSDADYENACCPNNPYYRRYMKGVVTTVCATGADGVYLDWTTIVDDFCYCSHCRRAFSAYVRANYDPSYLQSRYGIGPGDAIVPPLDSGEPLWFEWRVFRSRSEAEFHRLIRDYARSINPSFLMSGNVYSGYGGFSASAYFDGADIEMLGEIDDILYSEMAGDTEDPAEGRKYISRNDGGVRVSNSPLIRHLAAAGGGKPALVYCFYPESPNPVPREAALYNLVRLALAEAFAGGAAFRRVEQENSPYVTKAASDFYAFIAPHESVFEGALPEANVAVLASIRQAYAEEYTYYLSAARALADARVPYRIITPRELTGGVLSGYRAVILPRVPLLSDAEAGTLRDYAGAGGVLISLGASGRKDEFGRDRVELALADVLGVSLSNLPPYVVTNSYGAGKGVYIPLGGVPEEDEAFYVRGEFSGPLTAALAKLTSALEAAAGGAYSARWSGPDMVEISLMRRSAGGGLIAHLVNYDVTINGEVTPAENIVVKLLLPERAEARSVTLLDGAGSSVLPFTHEQLAGERYVVFAVPRVDIYACAVVEWSGR